MSFVAVGAIVWRKLIGSIIPIAIKHWKVTLILTLLAIIGNQNFMTFQAFRLFGIETIPHIKEEWQMTQRQLDDCNLNKVVLQSAIESLNTEIDRWATVSGELQISHNNLAHELNQLRVESDQNVNDILNDVTPETCDAAIDYLRDAAVRGIK